MKIKKQYIWIGLVSMFIIIFSSYYFINKEEDISPVVIEKDTIDTKDDFNNEVKNNSQIKEIKTENVSALPETNTLSISLVVPGRVYTANIKEETSVFEAMEQIQKESTPLNMFSFKYTEHLGLGNFVNEINGVKGTPGKYWIYYVNGKEPSVGVSNYILKDGDSILWSQDGR